VKPSSPAAMPVENKEDGVFLDHENLWAVTPHPRVSSQRPTALFLPGKTSMSRARTSAFEDGTPVVSRRCSRRVPAALFRRIVRSRHRCRRRYRGTISNNLELGVSRRIRSPTRSSGEAVGRPARSQALVRHQGCMSSFRENHAEAWKAADELIQHVTDEPWQSAQKIFRAWTRLASSAWRNCTRTPR